MVFTLTGQLAKLIQSYSQRSRHDVQKAAGSCGAFVVHDKVLHPAVLYLDYLGILSAYIYNGKGVAFEQPGRASSMARDLCNSLMGKRYGYPSIACGDYSRVFFMDILRLHLTEQALGRFNAVPTRRNDFTEDQAALFIQNHCLSAGRTHIESYITHNFSPDYCIIAKFHSISKRHCGKIQNSDMNCI